jgi:hypothetical protein
MARVGVIWALAFAIIVVKDSEQSSNNTNQNMTRGSIYDLKLFCRTSHLVALAIKKIMISGCYASAAKIHQGRSPRVRIHQHCSK